MDFPLQLAQAVSACCGIPADELVEMISVPPESNMGDFALPCFRMAKAMRKAPPVIAKDLCETVVLPEFVERVEAVNGYMNFFMKPAEFARAVLEAVREEGENYGGSSEGANRNICIDYSSINIAKPFHIGHLSSTVIGHALYRIYQHMGYNCIGINHLGDWGTQFGKLIVAYKRWGDKATVEKGSIRALLDLYVRFHDEAENNEFLNDEARAWFKRIEDGDDEALSLFEWFKALTLREVSRVYDLLGIAFDSYAGESFYNDKMGRVIEELEDKNLLKLDEGAYLVDLTEYSMPPCIVLRSDGATLYATRDIAAALYRKDTYDFAKCLYVVAYQQDLHFRQWFKVVELMGYEWAKDLVHVSFGMVSMQDGTISTRKGKVVFLEEVLNASIDKALEVITDKSPDLADKPAVARQVGVGAVVWNALYSSRIKDIVFSWDKALNTDGETGPYVQYTHARCCAVLRKADITDMPTEIDFAQLNDEVSMRVVRALFDFKRAVKEAMDKNEPYLVSRAVVAICQAYNKFYFEQRIIGEEPAIQTARLALTAAAKSVISTGLFLVGLAAPERM